MELVFVWQNCKHPNQKLPILNSHQQVSFILLSQFFHGFRKPFFPCLLVYEYLVHALEVQWSPVPLPY